MTQITASMPCDQALSAWLEQHLPYIRGATPRIYRQYIKVLAEFFTQRPVGEIRVADVRAFQEWRKQRCGAGRVNAEVSALQMTMKEADLWDPIAKLYRPLPVPKKKVRQNMSEEEEHRLLKIALDPTKPKRLLAGHCLVVMCNTSMGFGELRHLRRQDVFLTDDPPFVEVNGGTKNDYRIRSIPLNFLALRSMRWIVKRWQDLGGTDPTHYILPHNARRSPQKSGSAGHKRKSPPIFTEPMGHIYKAARGILADAGLSHLDPYDMRSHIITKLLSDPDCSEQVYEEIAGHVGPAMKRRYSKQRLEKKRTAMDAACKTQVELLERQAESEGEARKKQAESEVRASLGLPEKPQEPLASASSSQLPAPEMARRLDIRRGLGRRRLRRQRGLSGRRATDRRPQTPIDLTNPAIQAEIARQVTLALQGERDKH